MSARIGPKKTKAEGVGQESSQLERQELGVQPPSFIWAVESAVKIEEEGLFRHVVTYL